METTERYTQDERRAIAETILSQFAGGRKPGMFTFMVGAKDLVALDGGVQFGLKKCGFNQSGINKVRVVLTPMDEYEVTFYKVRGTKVDVVSEHKGVYCEDLPSLFFNETNLLPYMGY